MAINAIIQARMSSSRFPGKVLKKIDNYPYSILELIFLRLCKVNKIDNVILATSDQLDDDALAFEAKRLGMSVIRGSLDDVYSRFLIALNQFECDHFIRITADCPLISPLLIEKLIDLHIQQDNDYTSTALVPTFPDGLDAEIIKCTVFSGLRANDLSCVDKEHVTYYIHNHPNDYKLGCLKDYEDFSEFRLTVDEPIDLEFINTLINDIGIDPKDIEYSELKEFIRNKGEEYFINKSINRNEGLKKSLKNMGGGHE